MHVWHLCQFIAYIIMSIAARLMKEPRRARRVRILSGSTIRTTIEEWNGKLFCIFLSNEIFSAEIRLTVHIIESVLLSPIITLAVSIAKNFYTPLSVVIK